ncbi:MAG: TlpA disulfide reductase family protein [Ardenticatenales bacterium]
MESTQFTESGEAGAAEVADGRVIEIGWQAILLPVVAIAVVIGGWFVGRTIGARTAPPVAQAPTPLIMPGVPPGGQQQFITGPDGQQIPVVTMGGGQAELGGVPDPDTDPTVYPLREVSHPMLGQPMPNFTLKQLDSGADVSFADYAGKTVLVNFWATWCPPCRREMPWLQKAHDTYKDDGFVLLAVDGGEKVPASMAEDTIKRYVGQSGLTFPVLWGDASFQMQNDWNVYGLPATFLVDKEGVVRLVHTGMFPNNATLDHEIRKVMGLDPAS